MLRALPRHRRVSTAASSRSAASPRPSSRRSTGARSSSTTRRRSARRRAPTARRRPDALVVYGTKAFPNVALLRLLAEEGIGADVSTLGELAFAQAAGIAGDRIVVHGNNKSDEELARAAEAGALVVLDSPRRADRARGGRRAAHADPRHAGDRGRHARGDPHRPPRLEVRPAAGRRARGDRRGAQPRHRRRRPARPHRLAARATSTGLARRRLARGVLRAARAPSSAGRRRCSTSAAASASLHARRARARDRGVRRRARRAAARALAATPVQLVLEPGRSLVARAGVTLYRVGVVKQRGGDTLRRGRRRHVRQPAPAALRRALHGAAREPRRRAADGVFRVAGKHCESGDLLIERVELPEPRRGDILAVPATGAYTLAMSSNYNAVPRPAAVLVRRRRGAGDPPARDDRRPAPLRTGTLDGDAEQTQRPGRRARRIAAAMWGTTRHLRKPEH